MKTTPTLILTATALLVLVAPASAEQLSPPREVPVIRESAPNPGAVTQRKIVQRATVACTYSADVDRLSAVPRSQISYQADRLVASGRCAPVKVGTRIDVRRTEGTTTFSLVKDERTGRRRYQHVPSYSTRRSYLGDDRPGR